MEYESITDFLFEGNSPDVLTEEQRYDFLLEYFEEEYLEDLNEEELGELYELVEGIVMKAIGGLAKKGLTAAKDKAVGAVKSAASAADAARKSATDATKRGIKKAGAATLRGAGKAANIATLGTARAGINVGRKVAGAVKRTVGAEVERQASQARSAPGRKADKKHLAAYDKFKAKQAEKAERSKRFQSSRLGRAIRHFGSGVMGKEEPRPVADDYSPSKNEFYNRVYGIVQETVDIPKFRSETHKRIQQSHSRGGLTNLGRSDMMTKLRQGKLDPTRSSSSRRQRELKPKETDPKLRRQRFRGKGRPHIAEAADEGFVKSKLAKKAAATSGAKRVRDLKKKGTKMTSNVKRIAKKGNKIVSKKVGAETNVKTGAALQIGQRAERAKNRKAGVGLPAETPEVRKADAQLDITKRAGDRK